MVTKDGFHIGYVEGNHTVTVTKSIKDNNFDVALATARDLLQCFKQGSMGSEWGCDGVGYTIQKRIGMVRVNKSGVSVKEFQRGITSVKGRKNNNG
jgi:hypothetical protein